MGTTFITLGRGLDGSTARQGSQVGFWMYDSDLELLLRLLSLHIGEPLTGEDGQNARSIRDQWLLASGAGFIGCVPHGLEEITASEGCHSIAKSALSSLIASLDEMPLSLPGQMYSLLGLGPSSVRDIDIRRLRRLADAVKDLFEGHVSTTSADRMIVPAD